VAVAAATGGSRADAANGDALKIGNASQAGTAPTGLIDSEFFTIVASPGSYALAGMNSSPNAQAIGVQGITSGGAGVQGLNASFSLASIVDGDGRSGPRRRLRGRRLHVVGYRRPRPLANPGGRRRCVGELHRPSMPRHGTAGSLHPIPPTRVYDSRKSMTPMANGILTTGSSRTISVKDRRNVNTCAVEATDVIPAGATAVEFNLTIANTVGTNGFLAINPGTDTVVHASHINWFGASQINANSGAIPVDGSRRVTVIAGGTSTSCHFIVDITGYYL
jgi:hypothetical protein